MKFSDQSWMVGEGGYSVVTAVPDIIIAYHTVPAVDGVCSEWCKRQEKTEQFSALWLLSHSFSS